MSPVNKEKNKSYLAEFKQAAVKQVVKSDIPAAKTAMNLGINTSRFISELVNTANPVKLKT